MLRAAVTRKEGGAAAVITQILVRQKQVNAVNEVNEVNDFLANRWSFTERVNRYQCRLSASQTHSRCRSVASENIFSSLFFCLFFSITNCWLIAFMNKMRSRWIHLKIASKNTTKAKTNWSINQLELESQKCNSGARLFIIEGPIPKLGNTTATITINCQWNDRCLDRIAARIISYSNTNSSQELQNGR